MWYFFTLSQLLKLTFFTAWYTRIRMTSLSEVIIGWLCISVAFALPLIVNNIAQEALIKEEHIEQPEIEEPQLEEPQLEQLDLEESELEELHNLESESPMESDEEVVFETEEQAEPIIQAIVQVKPKTYHTDYNNPLWPSPMPVRFVQIIKDRSYYDTQLYEGRITHGKAIEFLAKRANMSPEEFLKVNPIQYLERYMKFVNAASVLGSSIRRLEQQIHRELHILSMNKQQ